MLFRVNFLTSTDKFTLMISDLELDPEAVVQSVVGWLKEF